MITSESSLPSLTIASVNLWCFYEWNERSPHLLSLLKEMKPDVVFTQETQQNMEIDSRNQIEMLNAELEYPYSVFEPIEMRSEQKGKVYARPIAHGLGVLSRYPLEKEVVFLTKAEGDKETRGILICRIKIGEKTFTAVNLHFSNSDEWAEAHFRETLALLKQRKIENPILMGDFNIFNIARYKAEYGDEFVSSSERYNYISYPKDNDTLDYVLLPRLFDFESFVCRDEYVSDHRLITARIGFKE